MLQWANSVIETKRIAGQMTLAGFTPPKGQSRRDKAKQKVRVMINSEALGPFSLEDKLLAFLVLVGTIVTVQFALA
jgi:hypothetical protein